MLQAACFYLYAFDFSCSEGYASPAIGCGTDHQSRLFLTARTIQVVGNAHKNLFKKMDISFQLLLH